MAASKLWPVLPPLERECLKTAVTIAGLTEFYRHPLLCRSANQGILLAWAHCSMLFVTAEVMWVGEGQFVLGIDRTWCIEPTLLDPESAVEWLQQALTEMEATIG